MLKFESTTKALLRAELAARVPAQPTLRKVTRARSVDSKSARRIAGWALLALGLAGMASAFRPEPIPVEVATVAHGPLRVTIDEDGRTRVKNRYVISAPLLANAARIELEPGDSVQVGALLARLTPLEPPLLDARTRAQSVRRVAALTASRNQASSAVARARALFQHAQLEAGRERALSKQGASPAQALESAELSERAAREDLTSAEFAARAAGYELQMAQLDVAGQRGSRERQDEIELRAPVAGRVLRVMQRSAGVVQPGTPLLEIGDVHALEIVADVLTSDAVRMRSNAPAWIVGWGGERTLLGHVRSIEPSAFTRMSALGVQEQRVNVIVELDDPHQAWAALGDGYRVEVRVLTFQTDDLLLIPESAIFRRADSWSAFEVRDGHAHLMTVDIGHRNGEQAELLRGLPPGAQVIVYPSDRVADGVKVEPQAD